ncbi:glucose-1-phosphate adenylyltransferase [Methylomicrobium agile]|uniref:glucose-1-phosphate adenylyltransferase n=1 Tax=Methylomicrobium agile TaxID=39774 RepID=UPI0004DFA4A8|nr:glucose-1-phosphate adenylyltransferase [Methylomicrobium agile]
MEYPDKILAIVLAGGEGSRLYPLTAHRSKPAVPFGGKYRLVDFVISNLINSGVGSIYVVVQYKSQSLIEHLHKTWEPSRVATGEFVMEVPPQRQLGDDWFQGTANAVYQNLSLIDRHQPKLVAVFGADHVYRMDVRQMMEFHCANKADVTVAARSVPLAEAVSFGVLETDDAGRISAFREKPAKPKPMPGDSERAYVSMGNYLFDVEKLRGIVEAAHQRGETDFGSEILPRLMRTHRLFAYDFAANQVPGIKPYEETAYWRDVGTLQSYWQAHQDLLGERPCFDLFNPQWPIRSSRYDGPGVKITSRYVEDSLVCSAGWLNKALICRSIVGREVVLEEGAQLDECIILDYVKIGKGSRLRRVIVDKQNIIEAGTVLGFDREKDARQYFVDASGITVVPRGNRMISLAY